MNYDMEKFSLIETGEYLFTVYNYITKNDTGDIFVDSNRIESMFNVTLDKNVFTDIVEHDLGYFIHYNSLRLIDPKDDNIMRFVNFLSSKVKNQQIKADNGKTQIGLFPKEAIEWGSKAMEYGISKYYRGSYIEVDRERYINACLRHIYSCQKDKKWDFTVTDEESGLPSIVQAFINLAFIVTLSERQGDFK